MIQPVTQPGTQPAPLAGTQPLPLLAIRHGPTAWNREKRLQGRSDVPLSAEGVARVQRWQVPSLPPRALILSSPLQRARETARLLGLAPIRLSPLLTEMSFGLWEGHRRPDLYAQASPEQAVAMRANEARGLDFLPPGGESPRMVQARLKLLLIQLVSGRRPALLVTHKGVLRALVGLATGWDMAHPYAEDLDHDGAHRFSLGPGPTLTLEALNVPLITAPDLITAPKK